MIATKARAEGTTRWRARHSSREGSIDLRSRGFKRTSRQPEKPLQATGRIATDDYPAEGGEKW